MAGKNCGVFIGFLLPRMYFGPRSVPSRLIRMPGVKTHRPFSFTTPSMALPRPLCSAQPAFPARGRPLGPTLGELNTRCVSPTHLVHVPNVCPINTSCVQLTQPVFKRHNVCPINPTCSSNPTCVCSTCQARPHAQPAARGQPLEWSRWHANPQDGYAISAPLEPI